MGIQLRYKSASQAHVAGSTLTFKNWIPRRGPTGGRVVVDRFWPVFTGTDVDVAGTAVEGEDCWRFFRRILVEQVDGRQRWNLTGDESRVACYLLMGSDRVPEFADLAIANNQTPSFMIPIPMAKRFTKRPKDYSLPAELLSRFAIDCADAAEVGVAGGTIGIVGSYYVIAECHEEKSIELKCEDEVKAFVLANTSGGQLVVGGRLTDLSLFQRAASGGGSLANLTDVRIDQAVPDALLRNPDLKEMYAAARYAAHNLPSTDGDPIHNDPHTLATMVACPVLWSTEESSAVDGPVLDETIVRLTNSVPSLEAIYRVVVPKSHGLALGVMRRHGLRDDSFRMKTKGKTKRDPGKWAPHEAVFLPASAPDKNGPPG